MTERAPCTRRLSMERSESNETMAKTERLKILFCHSLHLCILIQTGRTLHHNNRSRITKYLTVLMLTFIFLTCYAGPLSPRYGAFLCCGWRKVAKHMDDRWKYIYIYINSGQRRGDDFLSLEELEYVFDKFPKCSDLKQYRMRYRKLLPTVIIIIIIIIHRRL
jgi:hypothetical protein